MIANTVSLVIPYKENPSHPDAWMIETLEGIAAQTDSDWEVFWIGDPPRHNFASIIPMTVVLYENNVSRRINIGARLSTGKYILPMSSNDPINKSLVATIRQSFDTNPNALFWTCAGGIGPQVMENSTVSGSVAYRREFFEELNGFWVFYYNGKPRNGLEDWYMWMRIWSRGFADRGVFAGMHLVSWRAHEDGSLNRDAICLPGWEDHTTWVKKTAHIVPRVVVNYDTTKTTRFKSENDVRWVDSYRVDDRGIDEHGIMDYASL